jgi:hypothetical protein
MYALVVTPRYSEVRQQQGDYIVYFEKNSPS